MPHADHPSNDAAGAHGGHEALDGPQEPPRDPRESDGGSRRALVAAAVFGALALLLLTDVLTDVGHGASPAHLGTEIASIALATGAVAWLLRDVARSQADARRLATDLQAARADAERWRAEAREAVRGLGAAIERQFERWGLSVAERDVGFLLLHGMSLADIARDRRTSERTVRQQAQSVYRKAGLSGRAELAAFFLEDLRGG